MYFNKIAHPSNFVFAGKAEPATASLQLGKETLHLKVQDLGGDTHRLRLESARWSEHGSTAELAEAIEGESLHWLGFDAQARLRLASIEDGNSLLEGKKGACFGVCGQSWMFQFELGEDTQFFGLGEHSQGLDKRGQRVKFWNTDLFGDFAHSQISDAYANPMYVSIPWLIIKRGNVYVGILVHNPGAVFMDLGSNFVWHEGNKEDLQRRSFYVGAHSGTPELYVIAGPDLPALVRKFQQLVGRVNLPPLWALGHHQCRWGYAGPKDLYDLDARFREHGIPCDGLWLDIDYMDAYRVFTFNPQLWGDQAAVRKHLTKLAKLKRRVIPILDPGVKAEEGFELCEDGLARRIFCLTPEGEPFNGFVWPGRTHMPDFSLERTRAWWAERVRQLAELGIPGAWLDMNDPSVGAVELEDMLFDEGRKPHAYYHNQYALGMAKASHAGFLEARPDQRPFLLSRSAYLSSSRYTAVWTGDNVSNWHHLRQSIPISLGLALSGMPFNGPDVAGFMYDTQPALAMAWYKTCFLFPFLRNHSTMGSRDQEPWALGAAALRCIARYVRLRYKLLPYLYQLFIAQEERGEAILRPLFHDFEDSAQAQLGHIADEFMIGPAILQAPVVEEEARGRALTLPGNNAWYAAHEGRWVAPGRTSTVPPRDGTPLYVREGAIVPMQAGERRSHENDLAEIELHCFLRLDSTESGCLRYAFDDGESFAYRRGERSSFSLEAWSLPDEGLAVRVRDLHTAHGSARIRLVVYDKFKYVRLIQGGGERRLALSSHPWNFTGARLRTLASTWISLKA